MSERTLTGWDRFATASAHPVRALCWAIALGTFFGPIGGPTWVVAAVAAMVVALVAGELAARSRIRLVWLIVAPISAGLLSVLVHGGSVTLGLFPGVVGGANALWLSSLLAVVMVVGLGVGTIRILGNRGPAYEAVELFAMGGLLANAVASHRDGSLARPLWLSDLSWSFGVDPGRVLLFFGAMMTAALAVLLVLGADRRKPGVGLLVLPLVAAMAWMLATQLPMLQPPDPEQLFADAGGADQGGQPEPGEGRLGGKDPNDQEGGKGQGQGQEGQQPQKDGGGQSEEGEGDENPTSPSNEAPDPLKGGRGGGQQPVAVVLIDDDYEPPSGVWYLRQGELSDYNGTRLVQSAVDGTQADLSARFAVANEMLDFVAPLEHRREVNGTISLVVEHPHPFGPEAVVSYGPRSNPNPRFDRSYTFKSHMLSKSVSELVGMGLGNPDWSDELRAQYLEPPTDPRYEELAKQIRDDNEEIPENLREDPLVQAAQIAIWLGENMSYSKAERHADVEDPTGDFLFGNRIGYCVHSSHASVYLWRTLGIPSRIAVGYAVEESERRGSVLVVQSSAAHAWSEVFVTGVGWVPLDVVPHENLDESADPPDEDENQMLGEMARQQPAAPPGPRADYSWIWRPLGVAAGSTLGSLGLFLLLAHWSVKFWRRSRPLWASSGALARVGYRSALDQLADVGLSREHGETREAFARRLDLPALTEITNLHLRGQLGIPALQSRPSWTGLLARLRVELRQSRPLWRRSIGWFDPTSFYRAR